MQQTFVQAWKAAARFEAGRELGPWLNTIARRVAIDVYRRESRRAAHIRNTPNFISGTGALSAAASARASTLRVSAGSMMPSSHSRAVE